MKNKRVNGVFEKKLKGGFFGFAVVCAAAIVMSGCATLLGGEKLGSLTITGVPAQYEGGTLSTLFGSGSIVNEPVVNGTVKLASVRGK